MHRQALCHPLAGSDIWRARGHVQKQIHWCTNKYEFEIKDLKFVNRASPVKLNSVHNYKCTLIEDVTAGFD